jgi:hypothetical protein
MRGDSFQPGVYCTVICRSTRVRERAYAQAKSLCIVSSVLLLVGCSDPKPTIVPTALPESFRIVPGVIRVVIPHFASQIEFSVKGGQVSHIASDAKEFPVGKYCGAYAFGSSSRLSSLPPLDSFELDDRLQIVSPDGSLMIGAASRRGQLTPTHVLLFDVAKKQYVETISMAQGGWPSCLAWSPDSRFFVVLQKIPGEIFTGTFKTALMQASGHPVWLNSHTLALYDRSGQLLARQLIASDVASNWEMLEWSR